MPIVHACSRPGCDVLTMGEFCVDHEPCGRPQQPRLLPRVLPLVAVAAAAFAAALVRAHLPR